MTNDTEKDHIGEMSNLKTGYVDYFNITKYRYTREI